METISSPFLLSLIAIVVVVAIGLFAKSIYTNRSLDLKRISIDNRWVYNSFTAYAKSETERKYNKSGKPIYTKKGAYRADFYNEMQKKLSSAINECYHGSRMSDDFCKYVDNNYADARAKHLSFLIRKYIKHRADSAAANYNAFLAEFSSITPEEFFRIRALQEGDVVGVYIIHNESQNKYYVGQAKKLFFIINQHFTGHGNGDVYADYKYGDDFSIKMIKLTDSGYSDLDLLEKDLIEKYHAKTLGYNKTSGNR